MQPMLFPEYFVVPHKQFDVGNYAFTLLAPVRLVYGKIERSTWFEIE